MESTEIIDQEEPRNDREDHSPEEGNPKLLSDTDILNLLADSCHLVTEKQSVGGLEISALALMQMVPGLDHRTTLRKSIIRCLYTKR